MLVVAVVTVVEGARWWPSWWRWSRGPSVAVVTVPPVPGIVVLTAPVADAVVLMSSGATVVEDSVVLVVVRPWCWWCS